MLDELDQGPGDATSYVACRVTEHSRCQHILQVRSHGNVFHIDSSRFGIVIADVCGHGVPAALISISHRQRKLPDDKFVSLIYSIYDADEIIKLETDGSLVGLLPSHLAGFEDRQIQLHPGDRLLFYTDAIIESLNDDSEAFCLDRLTAYFLENSDVPIDKLMDELFDHVLAFSGNESFDDDVTMIGLEVLMQ